MKKKYLFLAFVSAAVIASCSKSGMTASNTGGSTPPPGTSQNVPSGVGDGVTFLAGGDSAIFNLYAPGKKSVYLIGDFNSWNTSATKMTNTTDGTRWWVKIGGLDPSKTYTYQYYVDGAIKVADPYSHTILDPTNDKYIPSNVYPNIPTYPTGQMGIVSVMQANPALYTWKSSAFSRPDTKNLVVYELLVRDFVGTHWYQTLTDTLDYVARLGVNAIELLPVNEFEGNDSWGYNSNFMFALDKYYGTPNDYKAFVDACHSRGIAVIQDIVLEDQFGSSPMVQMYWNATTNTPTQNSPWFDSLTTHPYGAGYQLNYQNAATVTFAENVFKYWLQEYHIDGFRLDQANGYTQTNSNTNGSLWTAYDADRVKTLTTLNSYVKSIDQTAYMILEEFAQSSEVEALAAQGMISWNNQNTQGSQAAMGYSGDASNGYWDLSSLFYKSFGIDQPNGLIGYVESHDEVRVQFKNGAYGNSNGSYNVKSLPTGLQRDAMLATFLFSAPGPKMLWMFGERGYDDATEGPDYDNLNGAGNTAASRRLNDQPPLWNYMQDPNRSALYNMYAKMIHYKTNNTVFATTNFTYSLNGAVKWIQLLGSDGTNIVVVGNFDVVPQTTNIAFPTTGTWYDNLSSTTLNVNSQTTSFSLAPGEYHLYSNKILN